VKQKSGKMGTSRIQLAFMISKEVRRQLFETNGIVIDEPPIIAVRAENLTSEERKALVEAQDPFQGNPMYLQYPSLATASRYMLPWELESRHVGVYWAQWFIPGGLSVYIKPKRLLRAWLADYQEALEQRKDIEMLRGLNVSSENARRVAQWLVEQYRKSHGVNLYRYGNAMHKIKVAAEVSIDWLVSHQSQTEFHLALGEGPSKEGMYLDAILTWEGFQKLFES
jgi:hypothetical protein